MITQAVREALAARGTRASAAVEVFVPRGEEIARKTLNARLGIVGGISILGTTGVVRPMSHEAFAATIQSALSVARASGLKEVVLTTGRRSERFAQALWPLLPEDGFIQIGDFFQKGLDLAARKGFERIALAVFFGKALKMAQGVPHTHAARSELTLNHFSKWARAMTGDASIARCISAANTAREAFTCLCGRHPEVIAHVGNRIIQAAKKFTGPEVYIQSVIFDYDGQVVFDSEKV
jgi:cobalt-precorrin-5B (C1)-methyltransferase